MHSVPQPPAQRLQIETDELRHLLRRLHVPLELFPDHAHQQQGRKTTGEIGEALSTGLSKAMR